MTAIATRLPSATAALALPLGLGAAVFPSYLPLLPVTSGVLAGLCLLLVSAMAQRVTRRLPALTGTPHVAAVALGGALTAYLLLSTITAQNGMRAEIGMAPVSALDVVTAIGTTAAFVGGAIGVRWCWRRRTTLRRRAGGAAAVALVALTMLPTPARAAGTDPDQVLLTASPVGAVRVYAGLSDSVDDVTRARIAVRRLVAAGGLAREHLLVVIPTGSGWVNPEFVDGVERRFGGDVATVAMPYDARVSWLAYLTDRDGAVAGARAIITEVVSAVEALPTDARPQVHVVGESLGATAGQAALTDRSSQAARAVVCSTFWLGTPGGHRTGLPRETVAANPTDPVVHARPSMAFAPTGDGRPWLPVVSLAHAGVDLLGALAVPSGAGHRYGADQAARLRTCQGSDVPWTRAN